MMIKQLIILFASISILFLYAFSGLNNWEEKISSTLIAKAQQNQTLDFLVVLKQQTNLSKARLFQSKTEKGTYVYHQLQETAKTSQQNILNFLNIESIPYQSFFVVNAIRLKGDLILIEQLAKYSEVAQILDNSLIPLQSVIQETNDAYNFRGGNIEWGIEMINADHVWDLGYKGQGVVVAGEDTGVEWFHPAIQSKYRGWDGNAGNHDYNWHDAIHEINPLHEDSLLIAINNPCGLDSKIPCDDHNHGTHTIGTMVGSDGDDMIGVAPNAKWIACRNMERGYGTPSTYIECFEWFIAPTDSNNDHPDPSKAPHVINNSWGCPEMEGCNPNNFSVMNTVVNNVKAAGIVVVVSAGNSGVQGCSSIQNPAAIFENSFTVGSSRATDTISSFSSRGPVMVDGSGRIKPNIVAPGSQVRSCIRNGNYGTWSGTSMAGPHVAGLVALIISANPKLAGQVEAIETIIENSAAAKYASENCSESSDFSIPNNTYGYGRINALAALYMALEYDQNETTSMIQIYPNPIKETFELRLLESFDGPTQFQIFAANGQLVREKEWTLDGRTTKFINIADLPIGVYFYYLRNTNMDYRQGGKLLKVD